MTKQETFIVRWKEYETLLRDSGTDIKDAENSACDMEAGRLRICRQIRNYLTHVDDCGFINVSDKMISFIEDKIRAVKEEGDTARKHVRKPSSCMLEPDSSCSDAFTLFRKLKCTDLLVRLENGAYGVLNIYDAVGHDPADTVSTVRTKKTVPCYCSPLDSYHALDRSSFVLCTDDGTPGGKLMGQVFF